MTFFNANMTLFEMSC